MPTNPMLKQALYANQMQQQGQNPMQQMQPPMDMYAMQQMQGGGEMPQQAQFNPFDIGISRAAESAQKAFSSMTPDQESRALRKALFAYGQNVGNQYKTRGVKNNLLQALSSLGPAVMAHDEAKQQAYAENQALAEKMYAYRMAEEARKAQQEQMQWNRDFHERQFAESKRYHDSALEERKNKAAIQKSDHGKHGNTGGDLDKLFTHAEEIVAGSKDRDKEGNIIISDKARKAERSRLDRITNNILPGGKIALSPEQKRLQVLGDTIRGRLFRKWGYRNETEFEHVPTIDIDATVEANLQTIQELKELDAIESGQKMVPMISSDGEEYDVPIAEIDLYKQNGFKVIGE